jgi:hypothetical protein
MQRNEVIIEQFIKTIKESPLEVQGDPVLLGRIFDAMEKKKKKRWFLFFFFILAVVVGSGGLWIGLNYGNNELPAGTNMAGLTQHVEIDLYAGLIPTNVVKEEADVLPKEKVKRTATSNNKEQQNLTVSYKFNNNQVDVHKQENSEFIQINVFGSDGSELDVFKMMEELKESYQNKELYVDSVNNRSTDRVFRTVRRPTY